MRKTKALTFSYDDGVLQDRRLIEILDRYELKATFNLNSQLLGCEKGYLTSEGMKLGHTRVQKSEVKELYKGHEVAAHTLTHANLTKCSDAEILRQVEEDRKNLSELVGYEVVGMAYPGGGTNHNEKVAKLIEGQTKVQYVRTITSSYNFKLPKDYYRLNPTVYHLETDKMFELGQKFLDLETEEPKIFYIWGHSFEFDTHHFWNRFEEFCQMMKGKDDIFYGTNREVLSGSWFR